MIVGFDLFIWIYSSDVLFVTRIKFDTFFTKNPQSANTRALMLLCVADCFIHIKIVKVTTQMEAIKRDWFRTRALVRWCAADSWITNINTANVMDI